MWVRSKLFNCFTGDTAIFLIMRGSRGHGAHKRLKSKTITRNDSQSTFQQSDTPFVAKNHLATSCWVTARSLEFHSDREDRVPTQYQKLEIWNLIPNQFKFQLLTPSSHGERWIWSWQHFLVILLFLSTLFVSKTMIFLTNRPLVIYKGSLSHFDQTCDEDFSVTT